MNRYLLHRQIMPGIRRFPAVFVLLCVWCSCLFIQVFFKPGFTSLPFFSNVLEPYLPAVTKTSCLGIPLFILLSLFYETYIHSRHVFWTHCIGGILLGIYFMDVTLFNSSTQDSVLMTQEFFSLLFFLLLSVSFIPFFKLSMRSFWKFNNILFIKCLKTLFYSLGLLLLLGGGTFMVDVVFQLSLPFYVYQLLFVVCMCLFSNLYFLNQIPLDISSFEDDTPFPTFYYIFSTIYLLPLTLFSFLGFYLYLAYCLWSTHFPHLFSLLLYIVSLCLSFFLILQFELLKTKTEHPFTRVFLRYFYWITLPLSGLYLWRLSLYWQAHGITEFWFVLWCLLLWSLLVCVYFIVSRYHDIRIIPISLSVLLLLLIASPLKPFHVAVNSQLTHFIRACETVSLAHENEFTFSPDIILSPLDKMALLAPLFFLDTRNRLGLLADYYPYPISAKSLTLKRVLLDFNLGYQQ